MKTVLVTGSNGLLGQKITAKVRDGYPVKLVATSKGKNRIPAHAAYIYEEMDILDGHAVKNVIAKHRPDVMIHTAAVTNVDTCHEQKALAYELNVAAVQTLLSLCEAHQIQFIYISTDFVFDGLDGPYDENAKPHPISYYGETKLAAEELVKKSSTKWAILRTILVYGIVEDLSRSNIVIWAKNALEKGDPINVVNDQWRMPTLAEDLAEACLLAVTHEAEGIYHISGKDMMTIETLVRRVADFWNLDRSLIHPISAATLNQAGKRPLKTGFILDKAMTDLKYRPHSFEEGLEVVKTQLAVFSR